MTEAFGVTPEELRRVSSDLHEVSTEMKSIMASLRAQLAAEGPVWGGGGMGHQFAYGSSAGQAGDDHGAGYLAQLDWVNGSVDVKTGLLDYYADLLKQAADTFQQADETGSSPAGAAAPASLGGQPYAPSPQALADRAPEAVVGATHDADTRAGRPTLTTAEPTQARPQANPAASPPTATAPSAAAASGNTGGSLGAESPATRSSSGPSTSGDPHHNDPPNEALEPSSATPTTPDSALPDDAVPTSVDPGDTQGVPLDYSALEAAPDPLISPPNTAPLGQAANPTVPDPPAPPNPPTQPSAPAPPNPRRVGAPDPPSSESSTPARDARSGAAEPAAVPRTEPDTQRTTSGQAGARLPSGTGVDRPSPNSSSASDRSGPVAAPERALGADSIGPEGAARTRRARSDSTRRSVSKGEQIAADGGGLTATHHDEANGDGQDWRSGGEQESIEGASNRRRPDVHARPTDTDTAPDDLGDTLTPASAEPRATRDTDLADS